MRRLIPSSLLLLLLSAPASAYPKFWVMDDLTPSGSAGADVVIGNLEVSLDPLDPDDDSQVILFEPAAAFMVAPNVKLNFALPLGFAFYELLGNDDESSGYLGNLQLGAMFLSSTRGRSADTTFGGGISFSGITASDEDDELIGAGLATLFTALRDFGKYAPNTNTLRLHGGIRADLDRIFFQGELGLHLFFYDDDTADDDDGALRIGLGFGAFITPSLAFLAEITNTTFILDDNADDEFYHVLDLGIRSETGASSFSVRLLAPLDDEGGPDALGVGLDFLSRF